MRTTFLLLNLICIFHVRAQTPDSTYKSTITAFYTDADSLESPEYFFRKFLDNSHGGNLIDGEINLSKAISLAPDIAYFYFFRGQVRLDLGKTELAAKDFNKSIEFSDGDSTVMVYNKSFKSILEIYLKRENNSAAEEKQLFYGTCSYLLDQKEAACENWQTALDADIKEAGPLLTAYCSR